MDLHDPLTIYATTWQVLRTPWGITSVGPGGSIKHHQWPGDTWTELKAGLPKAIKEKSVSQCLRWFEPGVGNRRSRGGWRNLIVGRRGRRGNF